MHIDVVVAGPNPACPRYFGRDGQRGKDALRELQAGLRKFALLTCTGPPPSPTSSSAPTTPTSHAPASPNGASTVATPPGLCLTLLHEVTRFIPHGFTTRAVAKHLVLPLAASHRTALCDVPGLLYRKQVTPAALYVVHAWDAPFHDLAALLQEYVAAQANPMQDSIYLDVLCSNLYGSATSSQRIKDVKAQLKAAPAILITLSSTGALNRTWVLYQIWMVAREHRLNCTTLLLQPPLSKEMVRGAAKNISLRHSMADQGDKDAILADVLRSHTASSAFDTEVYQVLLRKLMDPEEELAYEQQLQVQEQERQKQIQSHMEDLHLKEELKAFQADVRPQARRLGSSGSPNAAAAAAAGNFDAADFMAGFAGLAKSAVDDDEQPVAAAAPAAAAAEEDPKATASTPAPGGFDPAAFMAGFLGMAKSASSLLDDLPGGEEEAAGPAIGPTRTSVATFNPDAFMAVAALPPGIDGSLALPAEAVVAARSSLSGTAAHELGKLYKAVYFNHQRLVGMVHQFDGDDKGFLTPEELEEFIDFFVENCGTEDARALATAVYSAAGGRVDADTMVPVLKEMQAARPMPAPSPAPPAPGAGAPAGPPAFSKQESMGRLAALASSRNRTPLPPTPEVVEGMPSVQETPLPPSAMQLLSRLYKAVHHNHERLIGMVHQFDSDEKGYLTAAELEEFMDFFIEYCPADDAHALAAAVCAAGGGRVDADNMVPLLKEVTAARLTAAEGPAPPAAPAAPAPPAPPAEPRAASPAFNKQESMNRLAALASSRTRSSSSGGPAPLPPMAEAAEAKAQPSPSKQVLAKLYKAVYFNQERLVGMVHHFDNDEKGYLTASDMEEFIGFYVENCSPEDAAQLAAAICSAAGGRVDEDNMVAVVKALQEGMAAPRAAPATAAVEEPAAMDVVVEEAEEAPGTEASAEAAEATEEGGPAGSGEGAEGSEQEARAADEEAAAAEEEAEVAAAEQEATASEEAAGQEETATENEEAAAEEEEAPAANEEAAAAEEEEAPAANEEAAAAEEEEAPAANEEAAAAEEEEAPAANEEAAAAEEEEAPAANEETAAAEEEAAMVDAEAAAEEEEAPMGKEDLAQEEGAPDASEEAPMAAEEEDE